MNPRRRRIKARVEREKRWQESVRKSDEFFARLHTAIDMAKARGDKHVGPRFLREAFGTQPLLRAVPTSRDSQ
jgi:hypothetical protein